MDDTLAQLDLSTLSLRDGTSLRVGALRCDAEQAAGTVLLLHGRSEFIEKYAEVLGELSARQLDVFTFDWRGQGLSSRPLPNRHKGHIDDFETYLSDLSAVFERIVRPGVRARPLILLAHSMGAHIGLRSQYLHPARVDVAVHIAPMLKIALPLPSLAARIAFRAARRAGLGRRFIAERERTADDMTFEGNDLTTDRERFEQVRGWLERAPRLALGGPTVGWIEAALRSCAHLYRRGVAEHIVEPTLIVLAGDDTVVDNEAAIRFARWLPHGEVDIIAGAKHEVLMERDSVRARFWARFDRVVSDE